MDGGDVTPDLCEDCIYSLIYGAAVVCSKIPELYGQSAQDLHSHVRRKDLWPSSRLDATKCVRTAGTFWTARSDVMHIGSGKVKVDLKL